MVDAARLELTTRQRDILNYILERIEAGQPPSVREIGREFGIKSTNGVVCHLAALEAKGFIDREPLASRGIRVAPVNGLPVVGRVSAGGLVEALAYADPLDLWELVCGRVVHVIRVLPA